VLAAAAAAASSSAAAAAPPPPPRHVLLVVVDDLGFSDLGYKAALWNISGPVMSTPFLDGLAAGGVKLESVYGHYLCSPSRTALLSGRYAYTTGMGEEVIVDGVPDQLPTNIRTVADLLQGAGWATAAFGVSEGRGGGRGSGGGGLKDEGAWDTDFGRRVACSSPPGGLFCSCPVPELLSVFAPGGCSAPLPSHPYLPPPPHPTPPYPPHPARGCRNGTPG
jgi:hypothetical protein